MGCDGGTIPKRSEIIKSKQKNESRDKEVEISAKWRFCALSGLPLKQPVVACRLGRLYNKDAILEYLIELSASRQRQTGPTSAPSSSTSTAPPPSIVHDMAHVKSLKDVTELRWRQLRPEGHVCFSCPVTNLEMTGKYKFHYISTCGCVLSDKAIKEVSDETDAAEKKPCMVCSNPYVPALDLIVINGSREEVSQLKGRMLARRRQQRHAQRQHQQAASDKQKHEERNKVSASNNNNDTHNNHDKRQASEGPAKPAKLIENTTEVPPKRHKPDQTCERAATNQHSSAE